LTAALAAEINDASVGVVAAAGVAAAAVIVGNAAVEASATAAAAAAAAAAAMVEMSAPGAARMAVVAGRNDAGLSGAVWLDARSTAGSGARADGGESIGNDSALDAAEADTSALELSVWTEFGAASSGKDAAGAAVAASA
jgi:hypothetical protein